MTKEDLKIIDAFAAAKNIDILNTRAFKKDGKYILTVGSISQEKSQFGVEHEGNKFDIVYGEFDSYLQEAKFYMEQAKKYAADAT